MRSCGVSGQWRLYRSPILPNMILNTNNSVWLPVSRPSATLKNEPSKRCGQLAGHRRVPCENDSSFNVQPLQPPDGNSPAMTNCMLRGCFILSPKCLIREMNSERVPSNRLLAEAALPRFNWTPCASLSAICDIQPGITQLIPLFICRGWRLIQCALCKWAIMLYSRGRGEYISHRAWAEHTVQVILTEDTLCERAVSDAWQQWQQFWAMLLFLIIIMIIIMMIMQYICLNINKTSRLQS